MSENENLGQAAQEAELAETQETPSAPKAAKSSDGKKSKPSKKDTDKKPGFFTRVSRWMREMKSELKKVSWLTGKETFKHTGIVLLCVLVVGVFIWIFDALAHSIIDALFHLFG